MHPTLFYGVPAGSSFGAIVALEWLGEPYRLCRIAMPKDVKSAPYRRINPIGETPSLLTAAGLPISESGAILNHVNALGVPLGRGAAQGTPAFDAMNYALAFLNTTFYGAFAPLWHRMEDESMDAPVSAALLAYGRDRVEKAHADLEALLVGREWVAGSRRTVADAYFVGVARWLDYHQVFARSRYRRVHALYEALQDDPAVRLATAIEEGGPLPASTAFGGHVALADAVQLLQNPMPT